MEVGPIIHCWTLTFGCMSTLGIGRVCGGRGEAGPLSLLHQAHSISSVAAVALDLFPLAMIALSGLSVWFRKVL